MLLIRGNVLAKADFGLHFVYFGRIHKVLFWVEEVEVTGWVKK